MKAPIKPEGLK